MSRSFKNLTLPRNITKDPRVIARFVLGVLLLANLLAAFAIFRPLGGSANWIRIWPTCKSSFRGTGTSATHAVA